ncbi:N-6 DNA methylase [Streptomyces sp. NPDC059637]|uniref:N-6 DNA methylase n=1 Tax=Streptomyces sp. NPDC059637 TaxID=3347752 RepID=UPI003682A0D3
MTEHHDILVSRSEIAELAGVRRPAVSNWERRHRDFPHPVRSGEVELFPLSGIVAWLRPRKIPANALREDETAGTSYADRFLKNFAESGRGRPEEGREKEQGHTRTPGAAAAGQAVQRLMDPSAVKQAFGTLPTAGYVDFLLDLLYLRQQNPEGWRRFRENMPDPVTPASLASRLQTSLLRAFNRSLLPTDALEHRSGVPYVDGLPALLDTVDALDPRAEGTGEAFSLLLDRYGEMEERRGVSLTPHSLARAVARVLVSPERPVHSVHDPFCRSGSLLVAVLQEQRAHGNRPSPAVSGESPDPRNAHITRMHVELHGAKAAISVGAGAPFIRPGATSDLVVVNPPFNTRTVHESAVREHAPFPYGAPPPHNDNYAWLQHALLCLREGGRAAVLMAGGAAFSSHGQEAAIRTRMVEDGAVECLVAFPAGLFPSTGVAVNLWILKPPTGNCEEVLFIDAGRFGSPVSRTLRVLDDREIESVRRAYAGWRSAGRRGAAHGGVEGLSRAVRLSEIREKEFNLSPAVHVHPGSDAPDTVGQTARLARLTAELDRLHSRSVEVDAGVDRILRRVSTWMR